MGFFDKLKSTFTYNGSESDEEVSEEQINECRRTFSNPIDRLRNIKSSSGNKFNVEQKSKNKSISTYTKNFMYDCLYCLVSEKISNLPSKQEIRLLFKKFLEDKVIDENEYSDDDIKIIKTLTGILIENSHSTYNDKSINDLNLSILTDNNIFLQFVEVLDLYYNNNIMFELCNKSYVMCGFSYGKLRSNLPYNCPYFVLRIHDVYFALLQEVNGIISDDSSILDKTVYVQSKLSSMFIKVVDKMDINVRDIHCLYSIIAHCLQNHSNILSEYISLSEDKQTISVDVKHSIVKPNIVTPVVTPTVDTNIETPKDDDVISNNENIPEQDIKQEDNSVKQENKNDIIEVNEQLMFKLFQYVNPANPITKEELAIICSQVEKILELDLQDDIKQRLEKTYELLKKRLQSYD